jgi:hypothetical protein
MRHAWWALCPDGLGYHAKPAPIGIKDIRSVDYIVSDQHSLVSLVNNSFQHPEGRFQSAFITLVAKKFLVVTDLQGPPSDRTQTEKLKDLKTLARRYARDQGSCDDTRISYLEFLEEEAEADLTLARMISG